MSTTVAPRIRQLEPLVINKIAAGEVIERPASVIKELLENSIDALATRIEVDLVEGGTELIRIVDDGEGMHPDDLPLAVSSHATSKIRSDSDLFSVKTMGFRGEALASIASVSRTRIRSRQAGADAAAEMTVEEGRASAVSPAAGPFGTLIEVRQLFANTPVRRKFLKTKSTEFSHVSEQFTRIALANPNLHLVLRHNDKTVYELPAARDLSERLRMFYGDELARNLIPVDGTVGDVRLWGFRSAPESAQRQSERSAPVFERAVDSGSYRECCAERGVPRAGDVGAAPDRVSVPRSSERRRRRERASLQVGGSLSRFATDLPADPFDDSQPIFVDGSEYVADGWCGSGDGVGRARRTASGNSSSRSGRSRNSIRRFETIGRNPQPGSPCRSPLRRRGVGAREHCIRDFA